jgi:hypothetical protein
MQPLLKALKNAAPCDIAKFLMFTQYASKLKNEILVAQKSAHSPLLAPLYLPESVAFFLAESCAMAKDDVEVCWQLTRDIIWDGSVPDDKAVDVAYQPLEKSEDFVSELEADCISSYY